MVKLEVLQTGFFHSDGGAMFGLLPKAVWGRKYASDADNVCLMAMRVALLRTPEATVLFDAGAGMRDDDVRLIPYRFTERHALRELLAEAGVSPDEVTHVVLSHLHFDHVGGLLDTDGSELFRRAHYYVGARQWVYHLAPRLFDVDAFFAEHTALLQASGARLHLVDAELQLLPELRLALYDGHTPGQIASFITLPEGESFVVAGDIVPLALSLYPESISAFDMEPADSLDERVRLLDEVVRTGAQVVFYHDAYTAASAVKRVAERFRPAVSPTVSTEPESGICCLSR